MIEAERPALGPANAHGPPVVVDVVVRRRSEHDRVLGQLKRSAQRGELKPVIDRVMPLSEGRKAYEIMQQGGQSGKIVLTL